MPYTTVCDICSQPISDCECFEGPTLPKQPDRKCVICGHDPDEAVQLITLRVTMKKILDSDDKGEMRRAARTALEHCGS